MQRNQHPFNGLEQGPDFDRARSMIATPFQYVDIALDVAGVNQIFNVSGDFLYVDASSTGTVTLELNNQYNDPSAPFQVSAGFGLQSLFKQLKLTWAAQAGKKIRLMYSTGDKVVPTNSTTINGTVEITDKGVLPSVVFTSAAALGAGAVETVFLPSANANGAVIYAVDGHTQGPAPTIVSLLAKNGSPATYVDGLSIGGPALITNTGIVSSYYPFRLSRAIRIPAGLGLYFFCQAAENGTPFRSVSYTIL